MYKMKKQSNLRKIALLTVLVTITISTLATPAASSNEVFMNIHKTDHDHMIIIPGGTALCSKQDNSREQTLSLGDSAYILINHTITIIFESPCFRDKHFIMFKSKIWYNQLSWKNIILIKFTTGGLEINTENGLVINNENEIEYSENDFMKINSEIRKGGDCLKKLNNMTINIVEDNYGLFMGKCDLDSEKHNVELCEIFSGNYKISPPIVQYQMNTENILFSDNFLNHEMIIKPMRTTITIETKYCDEQVHITKFSPRDLLHNFFLMDSWFRFDYNVIKSFFSSSITISISGIPIDYWTYNEPVCDEEPEFTFIGVNDIKRDCYFSHIYNPVYTSETQNPVYTSETRIINFPYIITILLILLGKAICGYGIYKRRQARLIAFTARRIDDHYEDVLPARSNIIIVSANQQSESQFHSQRQPTEDLPPAYSDLQQTDSHPPGYEDACKSKSLSPPGYEYACRDNKGFHMETEISSSNNMTESMNVNQVSTEDSSTVSSNLT